MSVIRGNPCLSPLVNNMQMFNYIFMDKVEVIWSDSKMYITQSSLDEDYSYCTMSSIGYVIKKNKDILVLAGDIVDDEVRRVIVIPMDNIKSIKKIKL
jgi:hypothetical protein